MVYANGDIYVGLWAHDQKSFNGTMTYANGDIYRGGWVEDQRCGYGKFQKFENGVLKEGRECKWVID
jgi:hypothetical protein